MCSYRCQAVGIGKGVPRAGFYYTRTRSKVNRGILPFLTGSLARPAKTLGGFGLVRPPITNAYQPANLAWPLPSGTFTNCYHRDQTTQIDLGVGVEVRWYGRVVRWLGSRVKVM